MGSETFTGAHLQPDFSGPSPRPLARLDLDELVQLARLLGAELPREDTPARMLVRRIDDTEN